MHCSAPPSCATAIRSRPPISRTSRWKLRARPQHRALGPVANIVAGGITLFEANGHLRTLSEIEADVIRLAIGHYRGRMSEVARRLGIGRSTLYRKLAELGISDAA